MGEETKGVIAEAVLEYYAFQVIGAAGNLKWLDFLRGFFTLPAQFSQSFKAVQVYEQSEN